MLLAGHYVVPTYTIRNDRIARWDRFARPDQLPAFNIGFPQVWWYDPAKAAKTGRRRKAAAGAPHPPRTLPQGEKE